MRGGLRRPLLVPPDRAFVHPAPPERDAAPYPRYHDDVFAFRMEAGRSWWADYDYVPREAGPMVLDDARVASATLDEVRTMLTWLVCGERSG